jgi:protein TonB
MAFVGMPGAEFKGASPNAHLLVGEMPAPHTLKTSWREGGGIALLLHVVVGALLILGALHAKQIVQAVQQEKMPDFIFADAKGPGGGGGGSPKPPEPVKKAEIKIQKPPVDTPKPIVKPPDIPDLSVPVATPQATQTIPGALSPDAIGPAVGSNGKGTGIGTGNGPGVGSGTGGGCCEGAYQPGNGISTPVLLREVKPNYTGDAMRAKLQGVVDLEAVVRPDGSIDPASIRITKSLDSTFGLDEEAKKAVKQWRFRPGIQQSTGKPVPVWVLVELTFTLR